MKLEMQQNNPATFIGKPEEIPVAVFPGSIARLLAAPTIHMSPELRARFIEAGKLDSPTQRINVRAQPLGHASSFEELEGKILRQKMRFQFPDGLWYVAALIAPQVNASGDDGHLSVSTPNALMLENTVIKITFIKSEEEDGGIWSLQPDLYDREFGKDTRIIWPQ